MAEKPCSRQRNAVVRLQILIPAILLATISADIDNPDQPQTIFKTEVALVNVVFSVLDHHNRMVPALNADDFRVFEDRAPQTIQHFSEISKGDVPLKIALLFDTSASIRDKLDYAKETGAEFLRGIVRKEKDLALLIEFNSEVQLFHDFTHDPEELIAAMQNLSAGGNTALNDAVLLAVDEKLKHETGRRVVVVITDGDDTSSTVSQQTVIETAQKHDIIIYCIGIRSDYYHTKFKVLKKFAEETGGRFFSPQATMTKMQAAFQSIYQELENQYSLAYTSTNARRDGAYRSIRIRCKHGGVKIRARKGYYAPTPQTSS